MIFSDRFTGFEEPEELLKKVYDSVLRLKIMISLVTSPIKKKRILLERIREKLDLILEDFEELLGGVVNG